MADRPSPFAVYGRALSSGGALTLAFTDGPVRRVDVGAWLTDADDADEALLADCTGPTVDLGCGPGRLVAALAARGVPALGIDLSAGAVALARRRGTTALVRDLFAPLPGEGRWAHALLADGNIGIGGDPRRLLARVARLLAPGGVLVAEVSAEDVERRGLVRIAAGDGVLSAPFAWAELGAPALCRIAAGAGWSPGRTLHLGRGRTAVSLARPAGVTG